MHAIFIMPKARKVPSSFEIMSTLKMSMSFESCPLMRWAALPSRSAVITMRTIDGCSVFAVDSDCRLAPCRRKISEMRVTTPVWFATSNK